MHSMAVFVPSGAILEPSWGHLGAILGPFGVHLVSIWCKLGACMASHAKDFTRFLDAVAGAR